MVEYNLDKNSLNFDVDVSGLNIIVRSEDILFPIVKSTTELDINYLNNDVVISKKLSSMIVEDKKEFKLVRNRFKIGFSKKVEKTTPKQKEITNGNNFIELILPLYAAVDDNIPVKMENLSLDIKLSLGNLTINNLNLDTLNAIVLNGDINLKNTDSKHVKISQKGNIKIDDCNLQELEINNPNGSVDINNTKFAQLDITAEKGYVNLNACAVTEDEISRIETGIGNIFINSSKFYNLIATTFDGSIELEDVTEYEMTMTSNSRGMLLVKKLNAEEVRLESCDGSVKIEESKIDKASVAVAEGNLNLIKGTINVLEVDVDNGCVNIEDLSFDSESQDIKQVKVNVEIGDIDIKKLTSGFVEASTSDGVLDAEDIESRNIELQTSSGYLCLQRAKSDVIKLEASEGNVEVSNVESTDLLIHVYSEDISISDVKTNTMEVDTSGGKVTVDNLEAKEVSISSEKGDSEISKIHVDSLEINIDTLLNSAYFDDSVCQDLKIVTSVGDIVGRGVTLGDMDIITFPTGTEEVGIENVKAEYLNVDVVDADVNIQDSEVSELHVDTADGSVDISILESIFNYKTELITRYGNLIKDTEESELPSVVLKPKNSIFVDTNNGDIKVLFKGKNG